MCFYNLRVLTEVTELTHLEDPIIFRYSTRSDCTHYSHVLMSVDRKENLPNLGVTRNVHATDHPRFYRSLALSQSAI